MIASALPARGVSPCVVQTWEAFDARTAAFLGRSEAELVAAFGVVAQLQGAGGLRFLECERRPVGTAAFGGLRRFGRSCGPGYGYGGGTSIETSACSTTLTLRNGGVEASGNRGNGCRACPGALRA